MLKRVQNGFIAGAALVLASPLAALAEEAGHAAAHGEAAGPHDSPMYFTLIQFVSTILAFLIALGILAKTAWPKILGGLEARENKIRSEIFAAEEARKKAAEAQKEFERSLAAAKADAQRMIESTRAEQARLAADLRVKADAELTQLREAAMRDIEAAKKSAVAEIYAEAATLATTVASKILRRELNANDQRTLVNETMTEVKNEYARN
ncbi:MAG TPA: F0F1 ATP synthase subunit B [Phycisphaerales bacterium]|nr:F0F1 ATP synthase subunit B [Phycisphaerales bacterium]